MPEVSHAHAQTYTRVWTVNRFFRFLAPVALLAAISPVFAAEIAVHHEMQVRLIPDESRIEVLDRITLPAGMPRPLRVLLNADMAPSVDGARLNTSGLHSLFDRSGLNQFDLELSGESRTVTFRYAGRIRDELKSRPEGVGKDRQITRGIIGENGVFLNLASGWFPYIEDSLQTFRMSVELPPGWRAVSQGQGPGENVEPNLSLWQETQPQDDIYLIAAPFELYRKQADGVDAQVYLRDTDEALADRYLDATIDYVRLYSRLLGPYPYAKFALVENFWETGYGMPSFTLLGPQVIRLPFIIHTSYPHEVLHNWWGNSVYIDYANGNWAEGLTSYLADHLLKEQSGAGEEYRRSSLQRFRDFVRDGKDFPLSEFRGRHSESSQAVGYGKSLMMFHMLRRQLGDVAFIEGLRAFYRDNRFKTAGYPELRKAFETVADNDLGAFFEQWTSRSGAPSVRLEGVKATQRAEGWEISGSLLQTQKDKPFRLSVPVAVHLDGNQAPIQTIIETDSRSVEFRINTAQRPLAIDLDPAFDLFRQIDPSEVPPTLSALFGSDESLILLPARADPGFITAYRSLAEQWRRGNPGIRVLMDDELDELPNGKPVWLLGWENRFRSIISTQLGQAADDQVEVEDTVFKKPEHSIVLVRQSNGTSQPVAWLGAHSEQAIPGLARKLPHYGKYSYLTFSGDQPTNQLKGQWPVDNSAMRVRFDEAADISPLKPRAPLTEAANF